MCAMMRRYELRDGEWERIQLLLPRRERGERGRPCKDDRQIVNAILWILRTGMPWRELPPRYGEWTTAYKRYVKWRKSGLLEQLLRELGMDGKHL